MTPMRLLESGIPLSLLYDLVLGPHSADLLHEERTSGADRPLVSRPQPVGHLPRRALGTV